MGERERTPQQIIDGLMHLINAGKIKGQLARDLEALCALATSSPHFARAVSPQEEG